jgi:uncharacterized protein YdeI (YjbR/CyaY-like superfamily)
MAKTDKRIDSYISKAEPFAKPVLNHLRNLIHKACPQVEETIKWSFPHFDYAGATICSMASFKEHCAFGFWKASLMSDPYKILSSENAMGQFGRIRNLKDLPADKILTEYIKEAAKLNEDGVKLPSKAKPEKKNLIVPDYLTAALNKNKKALNTFENFSYSCKKEYIDWLTEAKTEQTRERRLASAIEWMSEGKVRNWKYMKK